MHKRLKYNYRINYPTKSKRMAILLPIFGAIPFATLRNRMSLITSIVCILFFLFFSKINY